MGRNLGTQELTSQEPHSALGKSLPWNSALVYSASALICCESVAAPPGAR